MIPRKMSRREMLKLSGAFAAGAVLAACAQPAPAPAPAVKAEPTKVPEAPKAEPTKAAAPVSAGAKEFEVWTGFARDDGTATGQAFFKVFDRFNELNATKYKAKHVTVPWGNMTEKVLLSVSAGNPPDVFRGWSWLVGEFAALKAIQPIDDFIKVIPNFNMADIWPAMQEQMKYAGKNYGLPYSGVISLLFMNKDEMKKGGVDLTKLPTTLDEWETIGEKLSKVSKEKGIERIGFCPFIPSYDPFSWYAAFGGESDAFWNPNTRKVGGNNDTMVRVYTWFKKYADKYGAIELQAFKDTYSGSSWGRFSPNGVYYTGQLILWNWRNWGMSNMKDLAKFDWDVIALPAPVGVNNSKPGSLSSNMYLIPTGSKNPDAGFAWGYYMDSDVFVNITKTAANFELPARKSNCMNPEFQKVAPYAAKGLDIAAKALAEPAMPLYNFHAGQLSTAADNVVFKGMSSQQALDAAVANTQREVDKKLEGK